MNNIEQEIVKMYQQGAKAQEICAALGTNTRKIYSVLRRNGINLKGGMYTPDNVERMVELARRGTGSREIARQLGCTERTVRNKLREAGIIRKAGRPVKGEAAYPPAFPADSVASTCGPEAGNVELEQLLSSQENRMYVCCLGREKKEIKSAAEAVAFVYSTMPRRRTLTDADVAAIEQGFSEVKQCFELRRAVVVPLSTGESVRFKFFLTGPNAEVAYALNRRAGLLASEQQQREWDRVSPGVYTVSFQVGIRSAESDDKLTYSPFSGKVRATSKREAYNRAVEYLQTQYTPEQFSRLKIPGAPSPKVSFTLETQG